MAGMSLARLFRPRSTVEQPSDLSEMARAGLDWLDFLEKERGLADSTVKTYRASLNRLVDLLPEQYSSDDLAHAFDVRMGARASTHVAWSSFCILNSFFTWWHDEGGPPNALRRRKRPPAPDIHRRPFTKDELRLLAFRLKGATTKDAAAVLLMCQQGLRESSVVLLEVQHIDFAGEAIRVKGKHRMDKVLPLNPLVASALAAHLEDTGIKSGYVFTGPRGQMTTRGIRYTWERVAGPDLKHLCAHQCRNTFANALLEDADMWTVMNLMGHKSLKSTQPYLFADMEKQRTAIARLPMILEMAELLP